MPMLHAVWAAAPWFEELAAVQLELGALKSTEGNSDMKQCSQELPSPPELPRLRCVSLAPNRTPLNKMGLHHVCAREEDELSWRALASLRILPADEWPDELPADFGEVDSDEEDGEESDDEDDDEEEEQEQPWQEDDQYLRQYVRRGYWDSDEEDEDDDEEVCHKGTSVTYTLTCGHGTIP